MRPNEFKEEYIDKVEEYLASNTDEEVRVVQLKSDKGYEKFEHKLKVKLPTIEGFAGFIGVSKKSVYNWEKENREFLHALDKIRIEQQNRLINMGLSGEYNPTIAKLILSSNHGMREKSDVTSDGEALPVLVKFLDENNKNTN